MVSGTRGRKKIQEIGAKPGVTFYMDYISGVEFLEKKVAPILPQLCLFTILMEGGGPGFQDNSFV